ncbi:mycofactocin-coupled SDR family oxidoreductase [Mycobacterium branderi]|uniref:3-ketoacyl-ACP reductase n=1 Tax=Mycobacterium branderi TaxID=43348 RepID=A0A7I7WD91_9MYCO|nr:mycofactocin-coupled SDR family oxidoreductase [Mycobacterium branderi]MCV7235188.1 mycofactocin-coupled SDR family oxidoreductase [Mycobacterium branderi]ORA31836.1 3-ketoacyl-ACP reductase [Mycobacterium branderi]BBZ14957.1 3-ketoacyl-ACP reductase [Mycobacterium branderi]
MGKVQDKVVFITGAGVGQGRAHAVQLAREGADIVAVDVCRQLSDRVRYAYATEADLDETRKLVENTGRRCLTVIADVRDGDALKDAAAQAVKEFDRIDAVCANAGVITFHPEGSLGITSEIYDLVIDTNLKGVWNTIQATAPHLIQAGGGSIVITSSAAGIRGQVPYAHYVAAKHGIVGLMKAFANELAPHRIRVNTIHPTGVASAMGGDPSVAEVAAAQPLFIQGAANVLPDLDAPADQPYAPVAVLTPEEVSKTVLFLISDDARYITGVQLPVDAGNVNKP